TDPKFLQAIAHSVDAQSMIANTYFGHGERATSAISPENKVFYDPNLEPYAYDLEKARALLTEGGYVDRDGDGVREDRNGNALEFDLSTNAGNQVRERLCSILKEDWTKLGIRVNYRPLEFTTLVEKLSTNFDWDAMVMGFTGGVEPHNSSNLLTSSGNLHLWQPNQEHPATSSAPCVSTRRSLPISSSRWRWSSATGSRSSSATAAGCGGCCTSISVCRSRTASRSST